jgi:two-component system, OmpR family, KDP operon response regulator KdpE
MSGLARVLIVDDEAQIRHFLDISLRAAGFETLQAASGREALQLCTRKQPELLLLDLGLPDIGGHEVIRALRTRSQVPIIVLSVRGEDADKVQALDAGANDYVQKPFSTPELLARIRACLRVNAAIATQPLIEVGELHIDVPAHVVQVAGQPVHLSRKEFDLLLTLARAAGRVCTHRQLLEAVWGPAHREDVQYLRIYVSALRAKLGDDPTQPRFIANEQGIGYRLLGD